MMRLTACFETRGANWSLRWLRRTVLGALVICVAMPWRVYATELAALLSTQLGMLLLAVGGATALVRRCAGMEVAGAGGALLLVAWLASSHPRLPHGPTNASSTVRLVLFNGRGEATREDDTFTQWLMDQDADLVCLVDPPGAFLRAEPGLLERYPHRIKPEPGRWWGIILLSRHPLESAPLAMTSDRTRHSFMIRRSVIVTLPDGDRLLFSGTHPPSPRSASLWRAGVAQAALDGAHVRAYLASHSLPALVAGDFNSTPTGTVHRTFARSSGLRAWAPLFGAGTWPSWAPAWLALPIDRVWVSTDVGVERFEVGPRFDSDHRPVVVDLRIAR